MDLHPPIQADLQRAYTSHDEELSPFATKNSRYVQLHEKRYAETYLRYPFSRDCDRILHSKAYSRYIDKTQVFYLVDNDHITHRVLHVQLVSKIGRTIGRALRLNEDLIEAIALGHDIGHVPFGHSGERILTDICREKKIPALSHNMLSVHFLSDIEDQNLTIQTLDGILCHNGEIDDYSITPDLDLSTDTYLDKRETCVSGSFPVPSTMEGAVIRFADNIAYLGRDLEDAIELGLVGERELDRYPEKCREYLVPDDDFSQVNRNAIDYFAKDLINRSYNTDTLSLSKETADLLKMCKAYNYQYIYENERLVCQIRKIESMFRTMFELIHTDTMRKDKQSRVYRAFINQDWVSPAYLDSCTPGEIARDFIASMTDRYFESLFRECVFPERRKDFFDSGEALPD